MIDLLFRQALVFDGSGAAPSVHDVAVHEGRIVAIGRDPSRAPCHRRRRPGADARHHRQPYPLRRPDHLGSVAAALARARRHHGGDRQLRLHDRPLPARRPRADDAQPHAGRRHVARRAAAGHRAGTSRPSPNTWRNCARSGSAVNVAAYVGHSSVRTYVMGADAAGAPPPPTRSREMQAIVREAMAAGAVGFASSTSPAHNGEGGLPMPSRLADDHEMPALVDGDGRSAAAASSCSPRADTRRCRCSSRWRADAAGR